MPNYVTQSESHESIVQTMPSPLSRSLTIFVVERQELSRTGYRLIFEMDSAMQIVGEGSALETSFEAIKAAQPQVALVRSDDLEKDVQNIIALKELCPDVGVLALADNVDAAVIAKFIGAGASGCCSRNVNVENLIVAVRCIAAGGMWFGPVASGVIRGVLAGDLKLANQELSNATALPASLTERESDILKRLAQGLTNQQIAETLHLSVETVKTYIRRIMDKSAIRSRRELVARYRRQGVFKF